MNRVISFAIVGMTICLFSGIGCSQPRDVVLLLYGASAAVYAGAFIVAETSPAYREPAVTVAPPLDAPPPLPDVSRRSGDESPYERQMRIVDQYIEKNKLNHAQKELNKAWESGLRHPVPAYHQARIFFQRGLFDDARQWAEASAQAAPGWSKPKDLLVAVQMKEIGK